MDITEFRQKYPQYNDMSDMDVAQKFHAKYYSDIPFNEFAGKFGISEVDSFRSPTATTPHPATVGPPDDKQSFLRQVLSGFVEQLPAIGAQVGSAAGGGFITPNPVSVATSGLGGAAGQSIQDLITELRPNTPREEWYAQQGQPARTPRSFMEQMAGVGKAGRAAMTGEMTGGVLGKLPSAFARTMTPESKAVMEFAKKENLPLSPSALSPTKAAKAVETTTESIFTGKAWATHKRKQLQDGLQRVYDELTDALPKIEPRIAGKEVGVALKDVKAQMKGKTSQGYSDFVDNLVRTTKELGSEGPSRVRSTKTLTDDVPIFRMPRTDDLLENFRGTSTGDRKMREFLEVWGRQAEGWTPEKINDYQSQINKQTWNKLEFREWGKQLQKALMEDLGPQVGAVLQSARDMAKLETAFNQTPAIKEIFKQSFSKPQFLINDLFKPGNEEAIDLLKTHLDKGLIGDTWDIARTRYLQNIFDKAIVKTPKGDAFSPQMFSKAFKANEGLIKTYLPEAYNKVKVFADTSHAALSDIAKQDMGWFEKGWQSVTGMGAAGAVAAGKPLMIVPYGLSGLMAQSMMNPKGWVKRILTEGLEAPEAVKAGIKAGVQSKFMPPKMPEKRK